ncbi:hypothetical protein [Streptomyces spiralis]|uniref:hypothetical protein n=1 Tax=Streptomyces spiralis TaxID=66376 RepID=UPI003682B913
MSERIIASIPLAGVKLSTATAKKVKAYEEAQSRYAKFSRENADCATHKSYTPWHGHQENKPAALAKAEAELAKMDAEALDNGAPLTDRESFLAPVLTRIEEYRRTLPLLRKAMESAEAAAIAAVMEELPALARQVMERATEEREAYAEALAKAEEAEIRFKASVKRFVQYVTGGIIQDARYRGMHTNETDKYLKAWEVSDNGRLTYMCAWSLGLVGPGSFNADTIDLEPLIEPESSMYSSEDIRTMTGLDGSSI